MNRSAIKRAYKENKQPMGIYGIRDSQNKIIYLGHAIDLNARINRHKAELKFGNARNKGLQQAWKSRGEVGFSFEIIDVLEQKKEPMSSVKQELQTLLDLWVQKLTDAGEKVIIL